MEMCPHLHRRAVNDLLWYHILLLRTGGKNKWTWQRNCGETMVVAYHPVLLEALEQRVEVGVVMEAEGWEPERSCDEDSPEDQMMGGFAWKEISVLKGAGSFHDIRKTMKELSANDTSRYPKVVKIAPNHGCQ